jgi:hypothetical protein
MLVRTGFAVLFLLLGAGAASTQPAVQLTDEIRRALETNARQLGPITVAWIFRSQCSMTAERAQQALKTADWMADFFVNGMAEYRMSWQEGKYLGWYRAGVWATKRNPGLDERDYGFDGGILYIGSKFDAPDGESGATLSKVSTVVLQAEGHSDDARFASDEFFDAAGLRLPITLGDIKGNHPVRSTILDLLSKGALRRLEVMELEGRRVVELSIVIDDPDRRRAENSDSEKVFNELREKTIDSDDYIRAIADAVLLRRKLPKERRYIFYLDPQLNYAVRRSEQRYEDGTLLRRTTCDDFQKLAGRDLYLPMRITDEQYTSPNVPTTFFKEPVVTQVMEVSQIKLEALPKERFALSYTTPGTHIYERLEVGKSRWFIVDDDGVPREQN